MPHISNHGLSLYYETSGSGPPLVFLHGYTATVALWGAQAAFFHPDYQVICLDQRGHGQSDATVQAGYTLEAMTTDVLALLDALSLERVTVIGHSMGGMIAQHLVSRHPEKCQAVVFSSTTPTAPKREYFQATVEWAMSFGDIPADQRAADPMMRSSRPISEQTARGCGEMMMTMEGFAGSLQDNTIPALVVHGSEESDSILAGSKILAKVMPNSRKIVIQGAGHVPQITHSEQYNRALADFLGQVNWD